MMNTATPQTSDSFKKHLARVSGYTALRYLVAAMGFVRGIYVAKYLGPSLMGTYGLITLIILYLQYSHLGVLHSFNLEISVIQKDPEKKQDVEKITHSVIGFICLVSAMYVLLAIVTDTFFSLAVPADIRNYIYAICLIGILDLFKNFYKIYARLTQKVKLLSLIEFSSGAIVLLIVIAAVSRYQLNAVIVALITSSAVGTLLGIIGLKKLRPTFHWNVFKTLIFLGIPILFYEFSSELFLTIDRLMIANYFPRETLGYYTVSYALANNTILILNSFTFLYYPQFIHKLNNSNSPDKITLSNDILKYSHQLEGIIVAIAVVGILLIHPFIHIFLEKYQSSIFVYQVLILGFVFKTMAYFGSTYLLSNKKLKTLISLVLVGAGISYALNYIIIRMHGGINELALATVFSLFLYSVANMFFCLKDLRQIHFGHILKQYSHFLLFFVLSIGLIYLSKYYVIGMIPLFILIYYKKIMRMYQLLKG